MTVTYASKVANTKAFGYFKLFLHWKGSVYKTIMGEFLLYVASYYSLVLIYEFALPDGSWPKREFESIVSYFRSHSNLVPLSFLLGFYVTQVFGRWWGIYNALPWVHRTAVFVSTYLRGKGERPTLIRRTLIRYLNLQAVLCLRCISPPVRKRFPTLHHIVGAGIMTLDEMRKIEEIDSSYGNYFVPTLWFGSLLNKAWDEGLIRDELLYRQVMEEANGFRGCCGTLLGYDWVNIPLVYTQVVTLATYAYFMATLFGRQYLPEKDLKYRYSIYFPVFSFIEFIFYVGWLKVGEVMINPLGGDDDDFEVNSIIDMNTVVGSMMVDRLHNDPPILEKDMFWGQVVPEQLYTEAAKDHHLTPFLGSMLSMTVSKQEAKWADDDDDKGKESVVQANDGAVKIDEKDASEMLINTVPVPNVDKVEAGRKSPSIFKRSKEEDAAESIMLMNEAASEAVP